MADGVGIGLAGIGTRGAGKPGMSVGVVDAVVCTSALLVPAVEAAAGAVMDEV